MESTFIQIPAALYASLYERFGERTSAEIQSCLSRYLRDNSPSDTYSESSSTPYPRPREGTITGRVWTMADRIKQSTGSVNREDLIKACMQEGINMNTASTQFSYWKKANR